VETPCTTLAERLRTLHIKLSNPEPDTEWPTDQEVDALLETAKFVERAAVLVANINRSRLESTLGGQAK
jgi:hypothetical protein